MASYVIKKKKIDTNKEIRYCNLITGCPLSKSLSSDCVGEALTRDFLQLGKRRRTCPQERGG